MHRQTSFAGDAQAMDFASNSFDLVYSRMLMEYLKDKQIAVRKWPEFAGAGGLFWLQDLDGQLLWHYPRSCGAGHGGKGGAGAQARRDSIRSVGRSFSFFYWLACYPYRRTRGKTVE